jgi:energy-converting hydrogenase Eha subunit E
MLFAADILGLGHSISSFGETFALGITFIGIGIIVNLLIVYAVAQVMAEHRQNQERMERYRHSRVD